MVDPGLQIRGSVGGGHPDSEISRGVVSKTIFFGLLGLKFSLKIRGRASRAPPPDPPVYSLLVKSN